MKKYLILKKEKATKGCKGCYYLKSFNQSGTSYTYLDFCPRLNNKNICNNIIFKKVGKGNLLNAK
jgi:hypothetical protein